MFLTFSSLQIDRENLILGTIPRIRITDKQSYSQSATRKYDTVSWFIVLQSLIIIKKQNWPTQDIGVDDIDSFTFNPVVRNEISAEIPR